MAKGGYRPNSGPPKGTKYAPRGSKKTSKPRKKKGIPEDIIAAAAAENMTPLAYMLKVMRDEGADPARRDRMAVAAAPFIHARAGEDGKKDQKAEKAKVAGQGRFAAGKAPLVLVK